MSAIPKATADFLAKLPPDQRKALTELRRQVLAAVPEAEEYFGYAMPGYRYHGHPLVYIGAAKKHCALYGMVPKEFAEKLNDFSTSKGSIRFTPDKPLPEKLVREIVLHVATEIDRRWPPK